MDLVWRTRSCFSDKNLSLECIGKESCLKNKENKRLERIGPRTSTSGRDWMNRCSDECISRDRLETETTRMWNIFPMLFEKRRKALQKYSKIFRAFVDTDFLLQIEEERCSMRWSAEEGRGKVKGNVSFEWKEDSTKLSRSCLHCSIRWRTKKIIEKMRRFLCCSPIRSKIHIEDDPRLICVLTETEREIIAWQNHRTKVEKDIFSLVRWKSSFFCRTQERFRWKIHFRFSSLRRHQRHWERLSSQSPIVGSDRHSPCLSLALICRREQFRQTSIVLSWWSMWICSTPIQDQRWQLFSFNWRRFRGDFHRRRICSDWLKRSMKIFHLLNTNRSINETRRWKTFPQLREKDEGRDSSSSTTRDGNCCKGIFRSVGEWRSVCTLDQSERNSSQWNDESILRQSDPIGSRRNSRRSSSEFVGYRHNPIGSGRIVSESSLSESGRKWSEMDPTESDRIPTPSDSRILVGNDRIWHPTNHSRKFYPTFKLTQPRQKRNSAITPLTTNSVIPIFQRLFNLTDLSRTTDIGTASTFFKITFNTSKLVANTWSWHTILLSRR